MYIYAVCHGVSEVDYGYCDTYTVYRVYDNETDAILWWGAMIDALGLDLDEHYPILDSQI